MMVKGGDSMKNIPVFTTQFGVASLILKEVLYKGEAYIKIQDARDPEKLLEECCDFCRAVGAQRIYASGHACLEKYSLHTAVYKMTVNRESLADTDAALFPVTVQTLEQWREIYNRSMMQVANASYMTESDGKKMLNDGDGYFIHKDGVLMGIGKASDDRIDAVVSCMPGAGSEVVMALTHALSGEQICLEVASVNTRAIALYERIGFVKTAEISRWFFVSDVM